MSYEAIAIIMFASMMLMLMTGQRVFGAIGGVAAIAALTLWGCSAGTGHRRSLRGGDEADEVVSAADAADVHFHGLRAVGDPRLADDLYKMFHVWMGPLHGGLAIGTIGLMVLVSAMNGLSVAGMAIGATIALPELLRRGYDKQMVTGVIQAGSSLGILVPPSVVLVLYAMIARQPVGQLWLAGVMPGLMMATMFILYIAIRCRIQRHLGPALPIEERNVTWGEKLRLLRAGLLPLGIFLSMMVPFINGWTSLVESSAIGAMAAFIAAVVTRRMTRQVFENLRAPDARGLLHVHVDHPGGAGLRRGVRRARRGEGDRGSVHRPTRPRPLDDPDPDAALLHPDGDLPGRHGDAGDRRAALCAPGEAAGLRSDLVRRAVHDHDPDRVYDAPLRLQPVPDARDGAAGDRPQRHLRLHHPVRDGDDRRARDGDGVSRNRDVAAATMSTENNKNSETSGG